MEKTKALNPNAKPWDPELENGRPEERTIFLTFSKGYPPSAFQIINFFNMNYGDFCIESIYVHRPDPTKPPLFGKVVFTKRSIPYIVLGDQEEKHFIVCNRSLWCKKYKKNEKRRHQKN